MLLNVLFLVFWIILVNYFDMERKFITKWQYVPDETGMEHPDGVLNTVPDQSLSIREILDRFRRGVAPAVVKESIYNDDDDIDDDFYNHVYDGDFDLTDRDALNDHIAELRRRAGNASNDDGNPSSSAPNSASETSNEATEATQ